jgi:exonuclease SbcC
MRLTLSNFRCYKSLTTFEFQDDGLILLSGISGIGKSTILMAINFVLYNNGTKLCSYGETKCRVELIFKNIKIVRSKVPNRLVVNDVYEDAVAQSMINDLFGTSFTVTGYIPQNTTESFLNKSPDDKRKFLESVKFDNLLLSEKKEKLDAIIKTNKQELDKTMGKLEMAKSMLPPEPAVVPFFKKSSNIDKSITYENDKLKSFEIKIKKAAKQIKEKENELNKLRIANTYISSKDENINQICDQLASLAIDLEKHADFIGDDKLASYQRQLQHIKSDTLLQRLVIQRDADMEKMENMKQTELQDLSRTIESIKLTLWTEYSKEEALSLIETNKEVLKDLSKVASLRSKIGTVKDVTAIEATKATLVDTIETINTELHSIDVLSCPQCDAHLLYQKDGLIISPFAKSNSTKTTDDLKRQLAAAKSQLKQAEYDVIRYNEMSQKNKDLEDQIAAILSEYEDELSESDIKEDLVQMEAYYQSQVVLEKKLQDHEHRIAKELFSPSYQSCRKELEKLNKQIEALEEQEVTEEVSEDDEETIRDIITNHQQKSRRIKEIKQRVIQQEQIKQNLILQKDEYLKKYTFSDDVNEDALVAAIEDDLKSQIKDLEQKAKESRDNLIKIDEYLDYKKAEAAYTTQLQTITTLEKQQDIDSSRYTLAKVLKNELLEVEHIAMTNIINDINATANIFLQEFFDTSIFVNLSCFKEDKKKNDKPQINVDVKYRDQSCDKSSLSGGEYARVNLAFTLSLAKIFKTPLLLLDETLSSLDEDASEIVLTAIRKHFRDIPVICILHQVTSEGDFDQVIKL